MKINEIKQLFQKELTESCIPFWLTHGADTEHGGLINCLDREGKIYSTDKSVWMQGRCAWMFSYIYNHIEKKPEYLAMAKNCLDFAKSHCIDEDGRMFFTVTRDGRPLRKRRYWFSESFYMIANAEYYMATGEDEYLTEAKKYYDFVYGISCHHDTDPYKITPKSYTETRATLSLAEPMILLNMTSIMREADGKETARYDAIVDGLITDIRRFHSDEYKATFECIGTDGKPILDSAPCRVINPGHDIEMSWFLLEEAMRRGDDELAAFAENIFNEAFERGWDKEYGGIFYFKDVLGMPVEAYEHDMKLWWVHNETVIASLMLYLHTGNEKYKEIFDRVCDYAFTHFSDPEYGEWYGYLRRDGKPTEPPCKGHTYKGPFHVMRMLAKCLDMLK